MTRGLSTRAIQTALAHESGNAFILLFTFTDESVTPKVTYRAANNTEDVVSRGNVFTACYFNFTLPTEDDAAPRGVQISIDNVDLRLVGLLRKVMAPIPCMLEIVVAATPDVVEVTLADLKLVEVSWDAQTVTGTLTSDDPLNQRYPAHVYEPRTFPGCF